MLFHSYTHITLTIHAISVPSLPLRNNSCLSWDLTIIRTSKATLTRWAQKVCWRLSNSPHRVFLQLQLQLQVEESQFASIQQLLLYTPLPCSGNKKCTVLSRRQIFWGVIFWEFWIKSVKSSIFYPVFEKEKQGIFPSIQQLPDTRIFLETKTAHFVRRSVNILKTQSTKLLL